MSFEARPLASDDAAEAAAVLASGFHSWPPNGAGDAVAHLQWLTEPSDPPHGRGTVVTQDGRIIGVSTRLLRDVFLRGERLTGGIGAYTALRPEFRGQGIWSGTRETRRASRPDSTRSDISISFTNVPQLRRPRPPRAGRARLEPLLEVLAAPLGWRVGSAHEIAFQVASRASQLAALASRSRQRGEIMVRQVDAFDERTDVLTQKATTQFDLLFSRDHRFMNWRFCDQRGGRFTALIAERGSELIGLLVLGFDGQRALIVDLLVAPDEQAAAIHALASEAKRRGALRGARAIECLLTEDHPYRRHLRAEGFVSARTRTAETRNMVRINGHDHLGLEVVESIHIALGDSDLI